MFKAILFDLDGTLLDINMDFFLKKYFQKMITMADDYGYRNANKLVEHIFTSTGVMISNRNPGTSNKEVFMSDFINKLDYHLEDIERFFNQFYTVGFPQLKYYCRPFPGIPEMMNRIINQGIKVIIATNAVFPKIAIEQRLEWAGLGNFDYELITSYENMHFCKPHIEYYKEIIDFIKIDPEECLMVGNDTGEDLPAGEIGIKTFLVEDRLIDNGAEFIPDWQGSLNDLFNFTRRLG